MKLNYAVFLFLLFGISGLVFSVSRDTNYYNFINFKQINLTAPISVNNSFVSGVINFTSGENVTSCSNKTLLSTIVNGNEIDVKSNVSSEYYSGGLCLGMKIGWISNLTSNQNVSYYLNFNTSDNTNFRDYLYFPFAYNFTETYANFLALFTERNSTTDCIASCGTAGSRVVAVGGNALYIKVTNPISGAYGTAFVHNASQLFNFTVSYKLNFISKTTGGSVSDYIDAGIFFRNSGNFTNAVGEPNDGYMFVIRDINNVNQNNYSLFKKVGGVQTILGEAVHSNTQNLAANKVFNFTLIVSGNNIKIYNYSNDIDLTSISPIIDVVDSTFTNGTIGFHSRASNGASVVYTEFNFSNYRFTTDDYKINLVSDVNLSTGLTGTNDYLYDYILSAIDSVSLEQIVFNASIYNSTNSIFIPNTYYFRNSSLNVPSGSITLTINNASYYPQTIYTTNNQQTNTNLSVYLLPISNPNNIFVRFWLSSSNGNSIPNALISIKQNGYNFGDKYTDSAGGASFWMDFTKTYTINITSSEGNLYLSSFNPIQSDYYLQLGSVQYVNFEFLFTNLTWSFFPDPRVIYPNASLINFTINSIDGKLEWFGLVLGENNTNFFNFSNSTSPYGGSIAVIVNTSNHTLPIFAHPYFKKVGFTEYYDDTIYITIWNGSSYINVTGLCAIITTAKTTFGVTKANPNSNLPLGLILLTGGFLFSGFIARYIGVGSGLIAMVVFAIVAFFGVFSPNVDATTIIAGIEFPNPAYWGWFLWLMLVLISIIAIRLMGV